MGSWFARIGILAIFLGAAFAFKYAVDRNLISPAGRVSLGLVVGAGFVAWGEWARRRSWPLFAQAVAGGGVAIMYLAVWAGYQLYDLVSPAAALVFLALVVVAGGALAARHDAVALAVIAALGGFLNPLLVSTGRGSLGALYLYLLLLDAGILGLAIFKRWRPLTAVSMAATWILAFVGWLADAPGTTLAIGFAAVYFLMFHGAALYRYLRGEGPASPEDLWLAGANSFGFFAFGMVVLSDPVEPLFALGVGLVHLGMGVAWRGIHREDANAILTFLAIGVGAITLAAALRFEGPVLATVWAVESVAIMVAAVRGRLSRLRLAGLAVFALSVGISLLGSGLGAFYDPPRLFFSIESMPYITQIAAVAATAIMLRRQNDSPLTRRAAESAEVVAVVLATLWLTFELAAQHQRAGWPLRTLPFAVATLWAAGAVGAAAWGLRKQTAWAVPLPVCIFAVSLAMSVLSSVVEAGYRPSGLLLSVESLAFVVQIAILGSAAVSLRRRALFPDQKAERGAAVLANLLALLWLSFELRAHYNRPETGWYLAAFTFSLSTMWTLYASGLLAFGIGLRAGWARLLAVALFGVVIAKLVLADVWLLETPLRIAALVGLGLVLLLCSLGYHRFRALILGPDSGTTPPSGPAKAA